MRGVFLLAVCFCLVQRNTGDIPPGIRNTICLIQHGKCRLFFCHSGERRSDICSDPWNKCCIPPIKVEEIQKPSDEDSAEI
uniref:Beta-defensin-like domain-containing protein n=1 Tax=Chinchilla lanigera TaxID=34839 RepID=A0A8C2W3Z0_CHILA